TDINSSHVGGGIFRSPDGGMTWQKKSVDATMCPSTGLNQCWYDHWIQPSPQDSATVYFGSIPLYKSTDGASTWSKLTDPYNRNGKAVFVHPDQHFGAVSATSDTVYFCSDGGLWRSRDGGQTFENLNATLTLAQFNSVALHPTNPEFAIG